MQEGSYKRRLRRFPSSTETFTDASDWESARNNPYSNERNWLESRDNSKVQTEQPTTSSLFEQLKQEYKQIRSNDSSYSRRPPQGSGLALNHTSTVDTSASNDLVKNNSNNLSHQAHRSNSFSNLALNTMPASPNPLATSVNPPVENSFLKTMVDETNSHRQKKRVVSENYTVTSRNIDTTMSDIFSSNANNISIPSTDKTYNNELENKIRRQLEEELAEFDTENVGSFYSPNYSFKDNANFSISKSSSYQTHAYLEPSNPSLKHSLDSNIFESSSIDHSSSNHGFSTTPALFSTSSHKPGTDVISTVKLSSFDDTNPHITSQLNPDTNNKQYLSQISFMSNNFENPPKYGHNVTSSLFSTPRTLPEKNDTQTDSYPKSSVNVSYLSGVDSSILKTNVAKMPPKPPQIPVGSDRWNRRGRLGLAKPRRLNSSQQSLSDFDDTDNDPTNKDLMQSDFKPDREESKMEIDSIISLKSDSGISLGSYEESKPLYSYRGDSSAIPAPFTNFHPTPRNESSLPYTSVVKKNEVGGVKPQNDVEMKPPTEYSEKTSNVQQVKLETQPQQIKVVDMETPAGTKLPALNRSKSFESSINSSEKRESSSKTDFKPKEQSPQQDIEQAVQISSDSKKRSSSSAAQVIGFDPKRMLKVNNRMYTKVCLSGRGGSSKVYKVLGNKNELYAIKRVSLAKTDPLVIQGYMDECKLLRKLDGNPYIIQLYDSEVQREKGLFYMVMELGEIDLAGLLRRHGETPLSMNFIRLYWEQMLNAVQTIHEAKIVHSDLKPANFLLVKGCLKLIDFGIAKAIGNDTTNIHRDQQIGTVNYMSPEALQDTNAGNGKKLMKLGCSSDVWSLGCILYQLCYGCTPFSKLSMFQKLVAIPNPQHLISYPKYRAGMLQLMSSETDPNSPDYIVNSQTADNDNNNDNDQDLDQGKNNSKNQSPATSSVSALDDREIVPEEIVRVVEACLNREPKKRPTIPELLNDSFLKPSSRRNFGVEETTATLQKLLVNPGLVAQLQSLDINDPNCRDTLVKLASKLMHG